MWDDNHDPFTNVAEVLVWRLRRNLDDGFESKSRSGAEGWRATALPRRSL
ncbi:MAG: hypothetical protein B7Z72_01645 [Gemmatimonadetes bacterium 21-71-4]|nr:MAG: hypothetical protein B7Z72_01645 [Gemmatimonadetes bacterium 21-71-4]